MRAMQVLKTIWFHGQKGDSHAERLESFYGQQASQCVPQPISPLQLLSGLVPGAC